MAEAIRTVGLTKKYGSRRGLDGLDLEVREGEIFGYLGPNGAGKSTTIRLLLDLIRPTTGSASVLGLDPRANTVELHRRVGYLAGDFVVDGRQSVGECLTFLGNLRGGVSKGRIGELAGRLDLELTPKIRSLSKGNRQKVGLVQAFMHRPELLILDEPTSGLDPLLQQTFLELIREAKADGQTVFMSSHIMSEVQATADRVGIIREGRLITVERVEDLMERAVRKVEIVFDEPIQVSEFAVLPGVEDVTINDSTLHCRLSGSADALVKRAAEHTVSSLLVQEPDLEELFFTYYTNGKELAGDAA